MSTESASSPDGNVNIAAVGPGKRLLGVLESLVRVDPRIRVTALSDPSETSLQSARAKLDLPESACRDEGAIYADPSVDWVFIGSPNRFHAEQVTRAFDGGKHVFCEKPLATDLDQVEAMVAAWKRSGKTFALGLVLRYAEIYRELKRLIDGGDLGRILSLEFNETVPPPHGGYIHGNWRRKRSLAGTHMLEKCCHDLDICMWLTGSYPTRAASFGGCDFFRSAQRAESGGLTDPESGLPLFENFRAREGVEMIDPFNDNKDIVDNQVAILEFASGIRASFHTNVVAALPERRFYMVGTSGTARADARGGGLEVHYVDPRREPRRIEVSGRGGHAGGDELMAGELAATLLEGALPRAGMREGLHSLVASLGIDAALDNGRVQDLAPLWERAEQILQSAVPTPA